MRCVFLIIVQECVTIRGEKNHFAAFKVINLHTPYKSRLPLLSLVKLYTAHRCFHIYSYSRAGVIAVNRYL